MNEQPFEIVELKINYRTIVIREAKKISYDKEENIDIKERLYWILSQVSIQYASELKNGHLCIKSNISDDLPLVKGADYSITNAIFSVIENGIEAILLRNNKKDGTLTINAEKIKNSSGKEYISIRIEDTGDGISDEISPDIFRFSFTTKTPKIGMEERGYGLWKAKIDLNRFNGEIKRVDQEKKNGGAIFEIKLFELKTC